ncbi:hypothetical protein BS17DRAFT_791903 [Gyrodon lividus]|nr:hypothetical protein BS17DRAFT_791998 [Gyrodon lividus]KAF9218221.1 hypothetical protein BS17DRAFT_791903 [Gyrodon lividus]
MTSELRAGVNSYDVESTQPFLVTMTSFISFYSPEDISYLIIAVQCLTCPDWFTREYRPRVRQQD